MYKIVKERHTKSLVHMNSTAWDVIMRPASKIERWREWIRFIQNSKYNLKTHPAMRMHWTKLRTETSRADLYQGHWKKNIIIIWNKKNEIVVRAGFISLNEILSDVSITQLLKWPMSLSFMDLRNMFRYALYGHCDRLKQTMTLFF